MVDYRFSDDQLHLQSVMRSFFEARSPLSAARDLDSSDIGYSTETWSAMAGLDWLRLGLPEGSEGVGGLTELLILYVEMGRALAIDPHLPCAVVAASCLAGADRPLARDVLGAASAGERLVVPAILEPNGVMGPDGVEATLAPEPGGWRLRGTKVLVPFAASAAHLLVVAREPDADGVTLVLVPADEPGVRRRPQPNLGRYPLDAVDLDVDVPDSNLVGASGQGWQLLGPALDRAAVLRAAQIAGAGERLLDMSVGYALDREQFGTPIGKFQAVQYLCTDIAIASHVTMLFALHAAGLADDGLDFAMDAAMAKAYASRAARKIVHAAHEVFAGAAFMAESDVPLFSRRMKHWELDLGDDSHFRQRIAARLVEAQ